MNASIIRDLADSWRRSGIVEGGVTLIHSSAKRTLRQMLANGASDPLAALLQSFLVAAGTSGTVVFPLFNFDFTKGAPFDIRTSKSQMGSLTEAARMHPDAVRSGHPIYSFAAIGPDADKFEVDNFSGYGPDSPFAALFALDGRIASLDLADQNSMTFYHFVEEALSVPYRYHKQFSGSYTGRGGVTTDQAFGLFVRDIENGVKTHVDPMGEKLWQMGLYAGERPYQSTGLRTIAARSMFEATKQVIESGQAEKFLYRVEHDR